MQARLAAARIHVQIDVGFGDAITPAATELEFPTLLADMPSPHVLAYPTETIVAEKVEATVHLGLSNSRMKDFRTSRPQLAGLHSTEASSSLLSGPRFVVAAHSCRRARSSRSVNSSSRTPGRRPTGRRMLSARVCAALNP